MDGKVQLLIFRWLLRCDDSDDKKYIGVHSEKSILPHALALPLPYKGEERLCTVFQWFLCHGVFSEFTQI